MGDQVPVVPPLMIDGEIRSAFLNLAQAMISQTNVVTSQAQPMMTQVNQEFGPRVPQRASTMAYHLRDFTMMPHPMFFSSKTDEDPQDFIDEVDKIIFAMGVTSKEKAELAAYQLKDVA